MADVVVRATSRGASLVTIARELASMDDARITGIFTGALQAAAPPFAAAVRAAALAIPAHGPRHTGLRARIAASVETASWTEHRSANVVVEINPRRGMAPDPPNYKTLPLYMEGAVPKWVRWRHPVFQTARNPDTWTRQDAHPFFYGAARGFGPAAGAALEAALEDVTRQISG